MASQYAIYFAPEPETALAEFGSRWLGRALESPDPVQQYEIDDISPDRLQRLTRGPRHFGFHSSLKPPFSMGSTCTETGLLDAAESICDSQKPFNLGPLELVVIGKFIALTNRISCPEIVDLGSRCVRAFDGFRSRVQDDDFDEKRRQSKLSVHQERLKRHWGYPYVMEEYRFHMALTGGVTDAGEREALQRALVKLTAPFAQEDVTVSSLCVMRSDGPDSPVTLLRRLPFSG